MNLMIDSTEDWGLADITPATTMKSMEIGIRIIRHTAWVSWAGNAMQIIPLGVPQLVPHPGAGSQPKKDSSNGPEIGMRASFTIRHCAKARPVTQIPGSKTKSNASRMQVIAVVIARSACPRTIGTGISGNKR
jgi:hypothetical protein